PGRPTAKRGGGRRSRDRGAACAPSMPLGCQRELAVAERMRAPVGVHLDVEAALRADDDARAGLGEAEERGLALEDLGQQVAPALVGAARADRQPRAALDQRQRQAAALLDHDPARAVADLLADAVERRDQE